MSPRFIYACFAVATIASCTETESATNLHTNGPPSIEQIRIVEAPAGNTPQTIFGFGWFPGVTEDIDHAVTSAAATDQKLRIIMGKLLVGNYLQQIACKVPVRLDPSDGMPTAFDNVPRGATPDDIAKCTESDVVSKTCTGALATCICQLDGGCQNGNIAKGVAVGIIDANADGAADQMRFMPGAVSLKCKGNISGDVINVPTDLDNSYWNPSGFQQAPIIPGVCGPCYDDLGPAIILQPVSVGMPATPMVPTNSTCGLVFSTDVVDKSDTEVCAAPTGRPPDCDNVNLDQCKLDQACTPGDVSSFSFTTEPLALSIVEFADGDTGVPRTGSVTVQTHDKVPLDPGSIANILIEEGTTTYAAYTVTLVQSNVMRITWTAPTGLAPNQQYTITFRTTFADFYHQGLPAPVVVHFTTGP
jgi:hypothetical protein